MRKARQERFLGKKISFTNGCVRYTSPRTYCLPFRGCCRRQIFSCGCNSDTSTKKLKGENRPINDEQSRALILASLVIVDAVVIFEEDTPLELIKSIRPDVIVKEAITRLTRLWGREVMEYGAGLLINPIVQRIFNNRAY